MEGTARAHCVQVRVVGAGGILRSPALAGRAGHAWVTPHLQESKQVRVGSKRDARQDEVPGNAIPGTCINACMHAAPALHPLCLCQSKPTQKFTPGGLSESGSQRPDCRS